MAGLVSSSDLKSKFKGIWLRALNERSLGDLTPELIAEWARDKGLSGPVAITRDVGVYQSTPSIVLEAGGEERASPEVPPTGDEAWNIRRRAKDDEALLWEKMEWFLPLMAANGRDWENAGRRQTLHKRESDRALRLSHIDALYACLPSRMHRAMMPNARSLSEIVPLAREAYLGFYSGYRASSIAALIPAIEGGLTRIVSDLGPHATAPEKIDHAINRAIRTAARPPF